MRETVPYIMVEHLATVTEYAGGDYALELNLISFDGAPAKFDLRKWDKRANRMLKGVTLSNEEAKIVVNAIAKKLQNG